VPWDIFVPPVKKAEDPAETQPVKEKSKRGRKKKPDKEE